MANDFFRFKQFIVHQDKSAMKVCTDACLFGAWVAKEAHGGIKNILDIGSGTGLLTLMLTQKIGAHADAVEIDEGAYQQSTDNFLRAPWAHRLRVHHTSIQLYNPSGKYDLIVSNPPFYKNSLQSPEAKRNVALHSASLNLEELLSRASDLLDSDGEFAVLLPPARVSVLEELAAAYGLVILRKCGVRQTPSHSLFRYMYLFTRNNSEKNGLIDEIIIKDSEGNYTARFYELLKDYYLFEK